MENTNFCCRLILIQEEVKYVCQRTDKALELLNERLARGEIEPEDYVTRKRALSYKTE
jgi:Predicted membrane protein